MRSPYSQSPRRLLQRRDRCASTSLPRILTLNRRYQRFAGVLGAEPLRASHSRPRLTAPRTATRAQASGDLDSMESDSGYWVTTPSTLTPSPRSAEHAAHFERSCAADEAQPPPGRPESARNLAPPTPLLAAWPSEATDLWTPRQAHPAGSALPHAAPAGAMAGGVADGGSSSQLSISSLGALSPGYSRDACAVCAPTCYEAPRSVTATAAISAAPRGVPPIVRRATTPGVPHSIAKAVTAASPSKAKSTDKGPRVVPALSPNCPHGPPRLSP